MDKTPQLIALAFGDGQVLPQIQQDLPTMLSRPVQPVTGGILVNLHNPSGTPQRIAFGQGTERHLEEHWFGIQITVRRPVPHRHALPTSPTQRLWLAMTGAIFDQPALRKGFSLKSTAAIRAIECLPVHRILPEHCISSPLRIRSYRVIRLSHQGS
jgi:hypothetical protein